MIRCALTQNQDLVHCSGTVYQTAASSQAVALLQCPAFWRAGWQLPSRFPGKARPYGRKQRTARSRSATLMLIRDLGVEHPTMT